MNSNMQRRAEESRGEQRRAEQRRGEERRAEQSRAEQSRAEQSRAEQSRAEQSRTEQSRAEHHTASHNTARRGCDASSRVCPSSHTTARVPDGTTHLAASRIPANFIALSIHRSGMRAPWAIADSTHRSSAIASCGAVGTDAEQTTGEKAELGIVTSCGVSSGSVR
jgi:ATPase subunit of ABC transporter with duplicated ATPase domains